MRAGFTMILDAQPDFEVIGEAENGRDGVELCRQARPDVVLMDIRMPEMDGIEATRLISDDDRCDTKVLVLTTFDLDEYVYAAMRAGASGYLLKDTPAQELRRRVRVIAAGNALLSPSVTKRLIEEFAANPSPSPSTTPARRSHRTRARGARAPGAGLSNREIAARCSSARRPPRPTSAAADQARRARPSSSRRPRLRDRCRAGRLIATRGRALSRSPPRGWGYPPRRFGGGPGCGFRLPGVRFSEEVNRP